MPQSEAYNLAAGTYSLRFLATPPYEYVNMIAIRRNGPAPQKALLDLHLFFIDGCGIRNDMKPQIGTLLQGFFSIFAQANIAPGKIISYEVNAQASAPWRSISSTVKAASTPAAQMARALTAGLPVQSYSVYFVPEIVGSMPGLRITGFSLGLPGGPNGTYGAGTVLNTNNGTQPGIINFQKLGQTMAHEVGHGFGLFHTSERDGNRHDIIADTAECPASADVNKDGILVPDECRGKGVPNLMFWEASGGDTVSNGQATVMRRTPFIYASTP
jgi:hypothetical protein